MSERSEEELRAVVRAAPGASSPAARAVMRGNRRARTTPELLLRRELHRLGERFRVDLPIRLPGRRPLRPDIVFTRARVAVFVDGCFWHGCPAHGTKPRANASYWAAKIELNQRRDHEQTEALTANGWTVLRVWEHETPPEAAARVRAVLAERRAPPWP